MSKRYRRKIILEDRSVMKKPKLTFKEMYVKLKEERKIEKMNLNYFGIRISRFVVVWQCLCMQKMMVYVVIQSQFIRYDRSQVCQLK